MNSIKIKDVAIKEILSDVSWSQPSDCGAYYELSVTGNTKDIQALKGYIGKVRGLRELSDKASITFYYHYWKQNGSIELYIATIDGYNIAYGNEGWSYLSAGGLYYNLQKSLKKNTNIN